MKQKHASLHKSLQVEEPTLNAEIKNCMKKVKRLAAKGKKLSDDGLLLEFRRRQLFKAKAKATLERNALELGREEEK